MFEAVVHLCAQTFIARSNQGKEQDSIAAMGKRLAFELTKYCSGTAVEHLFFLFFRYFSVL